MSTSDAGQRSEAARADSVILTLLFVASNAGYFFLDPGGSRFFPWLALYTLQFVLLVGIARQPGLRLAHVVAAGLAARILLWFTIPSSRPTTSATCGTATWLAHGINPFCTRPPMRPAITSRPTTASS